MSKLSPIPNTGSTGVELAVHRHLTGTLLPDCAAKRQSHQLLSSQHRPQLILILLYKLDVSASEDFYLYQKLPDHMKLPLYQSSKTTCKPSAVQYRQCWQAVLSFLTTLLEETFTRQQKCYHKSSESYHPKHSSRTDFISQKQTT